MMPQIKIGASIPMEFNANPENEPLRALSEANAIRIHVQPPNGGAEIILTGTIVATWSISAKLSAAQHSVLGDWAAVAYASYADGDVQIGDTVKWTTVAKYA